MDGPKLVKMANEIAAFFRAEPNRDDAVAGVAGHIRKFWDPRMRRQILELFDAGGDDMRDLVKAALQTHRDELTPVAKP